MKLFNLIGFITITMIIAGCSEKDSSNNSTNGRIFSGITERNEWGDTLSVDTTDWVITTLPGGDGPYYVPSHFPMLISTSYTQLRSEPLPPNDSVFAVGVFPNPFIPQAGRMILALNIPQTALLSIWLENEAGDLVMPFVSNTLPGGQYLFMWTGVDSSGSYLDDGIYRIFVNSGLISTHGDVQIELSNVPDPPPNSAYVLFASQNYHQDQYNLWEYNIATTFGGDGELGGSDVYPASYNSWQALNYANRFQYLPYFFNYDWNSAGIYQRHYLLAYKHFQFGAGWPDSANVGIADSTDASWQLQNSLHDTYVDLFELGQ